MTIPNILAGLQQLSAEAYVELFELDTSPLYLINGVQKSGGQVFRWTSGVVDIRTYGELPAGATQTTTSIVLDRPLPLMTGRTYMVAIQTDPNQIPTPLAVPTFGTTTLAGEAVAKINLAFPLPIMPSAGMSYVLFGVNPVQFQGNIYTPLPVELSGMEWSGQGKLPRPVLRVSNVNGLASALVVANGDMLGATITRLRTLREFLDDGSAADPTSYSEPEIYTIDRKSSHNKTSIEWECAAALDQQGTKIPRRVMIRDTCGLIYRSYYTDPATGAASFVAGDCPWSGGTYYTINDAATTNPALDACSHLMSGCLARYGLATALPIDCFPGISVTRS